MRWRINQTLRLAALGAYVLTSIFAFVPAVASASTQNGTSSPSAISLTETALAAQPSTPPPAASQSGSVLAAADAPPECDVGAMTWVFCPLITIAQDVVKKLTDQVVKQLQFKALDQTGGIHAAWDQFRLVANVFFVLIFFVIIFGTGLGLDNYTVKKMLPRLIAAAVLIQFSYLFVGFLVDLSNILGFGIDSILAAAIPPSSPGVSPQGLRVVGGLESIAIVLGGGFAAFTAGFAIPLFLGLVSAVIGLLAVFITLQIRLLMINFLIVLAPIAFLLWVLPNTEKYFRMWRETLIKLLLMFPIIVLLLGVSNLFSITTTALSTDEASNFQRLLSALAPVMAFFLIPATFKFAGSALMSGSNFVGRHTGRAQKGLGGMQDKMKANRAYNRQQKGLAKLNALNNGEPIPYKKDGNKVGQKLSKWGAAVQNDIAKDKVGAGFIRRSAQQQAGLSVDKIEPSRIAGTLEANDNTQLKSAARLMENFSPDDLKKAALAKDSDQYTRRAAIHKLGQIEKTDALQDILKERYDNDNTNPEWIKATAGSFNGLKEKAPHLVAGKIDHENGQTNVAYDSINADKAVKMDDIGAQGLINRRAALEKRVSSTTGDEQVAAQQTLASFDANARNVIVGINKSTAGVNQIKKDTREKLNELNSHLGVSIMTPDEKFAGREPEIVTARKLADEEAVVRMGQSTSNGNTGNYGTAGGNPTGGGNPGGGNFGGGAPGGSANPLIQPTGGSGFGGGAAATPRVQTVQQNVVTQNTPFEPGATVSPNLVPPSTRISGGWKQGDGGLIIPGNMKNSSTTISNVDARSTSTTTSNQSTSNSNVINAPSTVVGAGRPGPLPSQPRSVVTGPVPQAGGPSSSASQSSASTLPTSTSIPSASDTQRTFRPGPMTGGLGSSRRGGSPDYSGRLNIPRPPGTANTGPKPSIRLQSRAESGEPGDSRSIS